MWGWCGCSVKVNEDMPQWIYGAGRDLIRAVYTGWESGIGRLMGRFVSSKSRIERLVLPESSSSVPYSAPAGYGDVLTHSFGI